MARCGLFLVLWIAALQVFFFHSSYSSSFSANEVSALITFKEAIYEDPLQVMSNWNALDADPCGWNGIGCSFARDHVVKINITRAALKGFLAPDIGDLSYLRQLILPVISLCIKEENWTGYLELYFQREVADLARINHENTGKLLGYYGEGCQFSSSKMEWKRLCGEETGRTCACTCHNECV